MKRKSIIFISILLFVLSITTICFATDNVKSTISNVTNDVVDGVNNLGEDVREGIGNAENYVEDGINNLSENFRNDSQNAEDDMQSYSDNMETGTPTETTDSYGTTRTSADINTNNNTIASIWTWISLAIAAVVIVGLVWYYAMQNSNEYNSNH